MCVCVCIHLRTEDANNPSEQKCRKLQALSWREHTHIYAFIFCEAAEQRKPPEMKKTVIF